MSRGSSSTDLCLKLLEFWDCVEVVEGGDGRVVVSDGDGLSFSYGSLERSLVFAIANELYDGFDGGSEEFERVLLRELDISVQLRNEVVEEFFGEDVHF